MVNADAFRDGDLGSATIATSPSSGCVLDESLCGPVHRIQEDIPTEKILMELFLKYHSFMIAPDLRRFSRVEENWRRYFGDNAIGAPAQEDIAVLICGLTGLSKRTLTDLDVFDRVLFEQFERKDQPSRGRVIKVLEAYAATLGAAGENRPVVKDVKPSERTSGNMRV
jgi:hypothetical protein